LFWPYHDVLFANQNEADPQAFSEARLVEFGRAVGLDAGEFSNCLSERRYAAEVQGDSQAGFAAGMNSTPSFLINGGKLVGLVSSEEFAEIVEGALAASTP
jgi:protein-disulfide isomerase